ncbi:MAG: hypothetical protein D6785_13935 [Planctomycetota bacterium]|nr:MAG: hypothetical protein D6785_13935 [Planctomycetota bacterium]
MQKSFLIILFLSLLGGLGLSASPLFGQSKKEFSPLELEKKLQKIAVYGRKRTVLITVSLYMHGTLRRGYGSGAIISKDGYILTCAHVVELGNRIQVTLWNGKSYTAKKLGLNPVQDFALLKIKSPQPLPYFPIGNSQKLKLGQWVVAFGHPGGPYKDLKPAVSCGRITGLRRKLYLRQNKKFYNQAIRTDIPIFMGNSGGPLIDLNGNLIGINGAIIFINKNSYAIPIHQIMAKIEALKKGNRIAGVLPSLKDQVDIRKEIRPGDMKRIYLRLWRSFYDMTIGRALRFIKKWWKKIFSPKLPFLE